jgi:hypothetical protein
MTRGSCTVAMRRRRAGVATAAMNPGSAWVAPGATFCRDVHVRARKGREYRGSYGGPEVQREDGAGGVINRTMQTHDRPAVLEPGEGTGVELYHQSAGASFSLIVSVSHVPMG